MIGEDSKPTQRGKGQSDRLSKHKTETGGPEEMFHQLARDHDANVKQATENIKLVLESVFPHYEFKISKTLSKKDINASLNAVDSRLGVEQYVKRGGIRPEGGLLKIKDKYGKWRLILVGEAKFQGKDLDNIPNGWRSDKMSEAGQLTMPAGNVVERGFKNIVEVQNYMMGEFHFPYALMCYGSNFLDWGDEIVLDWPGDKNSKPQKVKLSPTDGSLNRIDRMTAGNYGMKINTNHCRNIILKDGTKLQPMSMYAQPREYTMVQMMNILLEISMTSIVVLTENNQLPAE